MKKTKLIILSSLLLAVSQTKAQSSKYAFVEYQQVGIEKEYYYPQAKVGAAFFGKSGFGFYYFGLAQRKWGQAYAGPAFSKKFQSGSSIETGLGGGYENRPKNFFRGNAYLFAEHLHDTTTHKGSGQLLASVEYGGSGYYYLGTYNYNVSNHVGIGANLEFDSCWGPRLEWHEWPCGVMFYFAAGQNLEKEKFGSSFGFRKTF